MAITLGKKSQRVNAVDGSTFPLILIKIPQIPLSLKIVHPKARDNVWCFLSCFPYNKKNTSSFKHDKVSSVELKLKYGKCS